MSKCFMSIALVTSSVQAFVADFEKNLFYSEGESYDVMIPHTGYAEQDPKIWYEKTVSAIRSVLSKSKIDSQKYLLSVFQVKCTGLWLSKKFTRLLAKRKF